MRVATLTHCGAVSVGGGEGVKQEFDITELIG